MSETLRLDNIDFSDPVKKQALSEYTNDWWNAVDKKKKKDAEALKELNERLAALNSLSSSKDLKIFLELFDKSISYEDKLEQYKMQAYEFYHSAIKQNDLDCQWQLNEACEYFSIVIGSTY